MYTFASRFLLSYILPLFSYGFRSTAESLCVPFPSSPTPLKKCPQTFTSNIPAQTITMWVQNRGAFHCKNHQHPCTEDWAPLALTGPLAITDRRVSSGTASTQPPPSSQSAGSLLSVNYLCPLPNLLEMKQTVPLALCGAPLAILTGASDLLSSSTPPHPFIACQGLFPKAGSSFTTRCQLLSSYHSHLGVHLSSPSKFSEGEIMSHSTLPGLGTMSYI